MDNPFVKFITITLPMNADVSKLQKDLDQSENKKRFDYSGYSSIVTYIPNFKGINGKEPDAYIRAVNPQDRFYKFLMDESGVQLTKNFIDITASETSWGCIVTEDYLHKLGYNNIDIPYIYYINPLDGKDQLLPIAVSGVVKQLPDYLDCIVSDKLMMAIKGGINDNPLDLKMHKNDLCVFFSGKITLDEIKTKCLESGINSTPIKAMPNESHVEGLKVLFTSTDSLIDFNSIKTTFTQLNPILTYDYDIVPMPTIDLGNASHLSIPFNSLDSIGSFQNYIESNHNLIRIDMNTIEAKSNFNLFDKISVLLIILLTIFGTLLLISLMINTIMNHIDKNKMNLGTLKAFGMSNWAITGVYTSISIMLVLFITIISYMLCLLLGEYISEIVIKQIMHIKLEDGTKLFNLDLSIGLILAFWIVPILIVGLFIYSKLHKQTPGDLIYERN
jgi:hypothetical protein